MERLKGIKSPHWRKMSERVVMLNIGCNGRDGDSVSVSDSDSAEETLEQLGGRKAVQVYE